MEEESKMMKELWAADLVNKLHQILSIITDMEEIENDKLMRRVI